MIFPPLFDNDPQALGAGIVLYMYLLEFHNSNFMGCGFLWWFTSVAKRNFFD